MKKLAAVAVAGGLFLGAMGLAGAQTDAPSATPERKPGAGRPHGAVRGELVVPQRDGEGFMTIRIDNGVLTGVDGSTLKIHEADGKDVSIPTNDQTRIGRDGKQATLGDLKAGDHVHVVREAGSDVAKGVRAISAERWEERKERREARRAGVGRRGPARGVLDEA